MICQYNGHFFAVAIVLVATSGTFQFSYTDCLSQVTSSYKFVHSHWLPFAHRPVLPRQAWDDLCRFAVNSARKSSLLVKSARTGYSVKPKLTISGEVHRRPDNARILA